jgi:hypothetical protein
MRVSDIFQAQIGVGTALNPRAQDRRNLAQIRVPLAHDVEKLFLAKGAAAPGVIIGGRGNFPAQRLQLLIQPFDILLAGHRHTCAPFVPPKSFLF